MEPCRWRGWVTDVVQSMWNLIVVGTLFLFWMLLFLLGGKAVFGEAWETLSLTRVVRDRANSSCSFRIFAKIHGYACMVRTQRANFGS